MLAHISPFASDYSRSLGTLDFSQEISGKEAYDVSPAAAEVEKRERQLSVWYK